MLQRALSTHRERTRLAVWRQVCTLGDFSNPNGTQTDQGSRLSSVACPCRRSQTCGTNPEQSRRIGLFMITCTGRCSRNLRVPPIQISKLVFTFLAGSNQRAQSHASHLRGMNKSLLVSDLELVRRELGCETGIRNSIVLTKSDTKSSIIRSVRTYTSCWLLVGPLGLIPTFSSSFHPAQRPQECQ